MSHNTAYARIINDGTGIEYAPTFFPPALSPATEADYLARGWLKNGILPPSPPDGQMVASVRYEAVEWQICAVYEYAPIPAPVTRYSKLKIYGAIAQMGAWQTIQNWLEAKDVGGVNGWMAFNLSQEIADNHPLFAPLAAEAQTLLGLTDEQFAALLASCVLEDA